MKFTQHPLSAAFPAMGADDFQALKDSIENIGVQNPITLFEGMVIDGWHRYTAATELGMDCPTVELGDVDPRDFAWGQNGPRRHMTSAQLASATAAVYAWYPVVGANQHTKSAPALSAAPQKTTAEMAAIAGVSERSIRQAKAVHTNAAPEVIAAVKSGEIGLPKAAAIAKLPKEEQAAAIAKPIPRPAPGPQEPEYTDLDAARDQISDLQHEVERLSDRLAVEAIDASEEEKTAASETIAALRTEVKTLTSHLEAVTISRDTLQEENAQLKRQCQMYRNKLDKLGKP
jgi:D-ribose pyranose/furanose isomerase RbsD